MSIEKNLSELGLKKELSLSELDLGSISGGFTEEMDLETMILHLTFNEEDYNELAALGGKFEQAIINHLHQGVSLNQTNDWPKIYAFLNANMAAITAKSIKAVDVHLWKDNPAGSIDTIVLVQ